MAIGIISSPVTWINGTVLTPVWAQSVQDNINGLGFTQIARAYRILGSTGAPYTSAGAVGGWTMNTGNFAMTSSGAGNFLMFSIALPYANGGSGTGATLGAASVRVKPAGASAMSAKVWNLTQQNTTSAVTLNALSSFATSSGTTDQTLSVPLTSPLAVDTSTVCLLEVLSGQTSDIVYSVELQYTSAGY